ncbi:LamG-like jellyroll fold domain-containing protein [Actinoplanes sp. NPDC049548]|uniref:LamG-like jellyroll fold domain-containing protein n=1 Tax=Actinoplanes sp. NPDC049548 TaxID=3155152 RepID=UPI00343C948E
MLDTRRSWFSPLGALAATAVLGAGLLAVAHFAQRSDAAPRLAPMVLPRPSGGVLTTSDIGFGAADRVGAVGVATAPVTVRYTFDGGVAEPITDVRGRHELRALGQNGGTLSLVPQGAGLAVQYPARCTLIRERECPRAILEGLRDDDLNPGTRPMEYGASILMTHSDLADGANVFQKGYSVGGVSQFKLQVDHRQGHPSCVIASRTRIYRAEPAVDVADGVWHDLSCARTADRLTLTVDGVERASVAVPMNLSIANAEPLRVGGKGANKGNDQYAGQIDNVFLTIS